MSAGDMTVGEAMRRLLPRGRRKPRVTRDEMVDVIDRVEAMRARLDAADQMAAMACRIFDPDRGRKPDEWWEVACGDLAASVNEYVKLAADATTRADALV
jgi:hypothetical protein